MKILFFSHQAEFIYGGEICTLELMRGLKARGVEVFFASPPGPYQEKAKEIARVFSVSSIQFRRELSRMPDFFPALWHCHRQLREIAQKEKINILHATSLKAMVYVLGLQVPLVWHHHDILPSSWSNRLWLRTLAWKAEKILIPSQAGAEALLQCGIAEEKVQVLYNGFDTSAWSARDRELSEKLQIAILGEISERKGSDWIQPIVRGLQEHRIPFILHVVGEGLSDPIFAKRIKKDNAGFIDQGLVQFHGRRNDIPRFLQGVDVLLVPSRQDPLPTVIVEAFLSGVPAIGAPVGGIPEMIEEGKNGFLAGSPEEFVGKIKEAAQPGLYRKLSKAARKTAEQKFSIVTMVNAVMDCYAKSTRPSDSL